MKFFCMLVFSLFLITLFAIQVIYLIKAVRTKDKANWLMTFSLIFSSILGNAIMYPYFVFDNYLGWDAFTYLYFTYIAFGIYMSILLVSAVLKVWEFLRYKKLNIKAEKLSTEAKDKLVIKPLLIIVMVSIIICLFNHIVYIL